MNCNPSSLGIHNNHVQLSCAFDFYYSLENRPNFYAILTSPCIKLPLWRALKAAQDEPTLTTVGISQALGRRAVRPTISASGKIPSPPSGSLVGTKKE